MDDSLKGFNSMGIKMESVSELHDQLNYPDLTGMAGNDMYNGLFLPDETGDPDKGGGGSSASAGANGEEDDEEEDLDDVIILHLDIQQPIKHLRKMLEQRIGVNLRNYEFWLQDAQMLEPHKNLVDQCVKGEGLVQINAQVRTHTQRINIVDVLKPTEDALAEIANQMRQGGGASADRSRSSSPAPDAATMAAAAAIERELAAQPDDDDDVDEDVGRRSAKRINGDANDDDDDDDDYDRDDGRVMRPRHGDDDDDDSDAAPASSKPQWIIDTQFKREQNRLKMSDDPKDWTVPQVKHWLQWAVRQFNLVHIRLQDWTISGKELNELTIEDFKRKVQHDPDNVFWTHLELLRRLKVVAIQGGMADHDDYNDDGGGAAAAGASMAAEHSHQSVRDAGAAMRFPHLLGGGAGTKAGPVAIPKPLRPLGLIAQFGIESMQGNRTGNNGQIQLWQFLLEILTDREHRDIIAWMGGLGEFKLTDPERVAQLWGERKNKSTMNYEKLSRALRYYYDGDMISKVHGKRFVYKFVCDLTQLVGYNAQELANLVNEPAGGSDGGGADSDVRVHFGSGADARAFLGE